MFFITNSKEIGQQLQQQLYQQSQQQILQIPLPEKKTTISNDILEGVTDLIHIIIAAEKFKKRINIEIKEVNNASIDFSKTIIKKYPYHKRTITKRLRSTRCGSCEQCLIDDCGKCKNCLDKPRYGGSGIRKKGCIFKNCLSPNRVISRSAT